MFEPPEFEPPRFNFEPPEIPLVSVFEPPEFEPPRFNFEPLEISLVSVFEPPAIHPTWKNQCNPHLFACGATSPLFFS